MKEQITIGTKTLMTTEIIVRVNAHGNCFWAEADDHDYDVDSVLSSIASAIAHNNSLLEPKPERPFTIVEPGPDYLHVVGVNGLPKATEITGELDPHQVEYNNWRLEMLADCWIKAPKTMTLKNVYADKINEDTACNEIKLTAEIVQ